MSACHLECTSSHCPSQPGQNRYCRDCSHAVYRGEGQDDRGRTWRWYFSPQWGPTFVRKDGQPLKRSPKTNPNHPAWTVFAAWYTHYQSLTEPLNAQY